MITALLVALAQVTPVAPIVHGTGLPPTADSEADTQAALGAVQRLLNAIEAKDPTALTAATRADGGATAAIELAGGGRRVERLSWAAFAHYLKPGPDRYHETITDPAVEVDGDIAMVWAPYVLRKNGTIDHCGYDHFDLVREAGQWRVLNVTWSQRTTGCEAR